MRLLIFGAGYSARYLVEEMRPFSTGDVIGTTRSEAKARDLEALGMTARIFPGDDLARDLADVSHVLVSAGPQEGRDPVLAVLRDAFAAQAQRLTWVGYFSTTGVYGDHQGAWIDETAPLASGTRRGQARIAAEAEWKALAEFGLPVHIFRLPGIYGPGRGPFAKVRDGSARRIIKDGQVFSRIHVEDIAQAVLASMQAPKPGAIYNICDDDPAPPQDVIGHAAQLLGLPLPPEVPFEDAELGQMAREFYSESKRVSNQRMKDELGVSLRYPTYRAGLQAILDAEARKS